ncbi:MAG: DNA/RNA nuclease SfsA [Planctomycetota bacterium]|jgi:sugar fermentation stimulation protein A
MPKLTFDFDPPVAEPATFLERPNRFLARCRRKGRIIDAFLPNPGRMQEILLPGTELLVGKTSRPAGARRKTNFTVFAAMRGGFPVFLHTHETNRVARVLIEKRLIEPLRKASVLRSEVRVGRSRFDFLLEEDGREILMEVKSCTLFGNGVAMFPDAVTERGRRHLLELASLSRPGARPVVLILVHVPKVRWFLPDYHTDPAFSEAFLEVRKKLRILPVALRWYPDLSLDSRVKRVDIPWDHIRREGKDRGVYLLRLRLDREKTIDVGSLGRLRFPAGHHVYVGSARKGLAARIARHRRLRKKMHWHVDFLRTHAAGFDALPIRTSQEIECDLARGLSKVLAPGPEGFGSSDCACPTHLLFSRTDPLHLPDFHDVLQRFRMSIIGVGPR